VPGDPRGLCELEGIDASYPLVVAIEFPNLAFEECGLFDTISVHFSAALIFPISGPYASCVRRAFSFSQKFKRVCDSKGRALFQFGKDGRRSNDVVSSEQRG
jgi:hypothetical protein